MSDQSTTTSTTKAVDYHAVDLAIGHRPVAPIANWVNIVMMPLSVVLAVMVATDTESTLRVWLAVLVFCLGPGSGIVQFFRLPDPALQVGLIFAVSGTMDMIVSQSLLWAGNLDAGLTIVLLTLLTYVRPFPRRKRPTATETEKASA